VVGYAGIYVADSGGIEDWEMKTGTRNGLADVDRTPEILQTFSSNRIDKVKISDSLQNTRSSTTPPKFLRA